MNRSIFSREVPFYRAHLLPESLPSHPPRLAVTKRALRLRPPPTLRRYGIPLHVLHRSPAAALSTAKVVPPIPPPRGSAVGTQGEPCPPLLPPEVVARPGRAKTSLPGAPSPWFTRRGFSALTPAGSPARGRIRLFGGRPSIPVCAASSRVGEGEARGGQAW